MQEKNEVEIGEWNRLVKDAYNSLEFLVTMHYLRKHLPEAGKVLDVGGGPGAIVCISVMGYLAMLRTVLSRASEELIIPQYWELIKEGKGNNLVQDRLWHFFRASELRQLAESCGLTTLEMVGCEGLSTGLSEATNTVAEDPTKWERWIELVLETATEPAIVDIAAHILYIGRVG